MESSSSFVAIESRYGVTNSGTSSRAECHAANGVIDGLGVVSQPPTANM